MKEDKTCKNFSPATYATCSSCNLDGKYTSCYGDNEKCKFRSFSGGKDSTVLHYLIDEALPGNQIPRVFINTGIEYKATFKFVKQMAENDNHFVIWTVGKDVKKTLNKVGWPFKSKEHSQKLYEWKRGYRSNSHMRYFRQLPNGFSPCP